MDEIWERAVESALDGQTDVDLVRTLTLDGAVKCLHGRLPPPPLFEKFPNLQHLSMANIGVSSLEQFPRLRNLQKLILSDNRIAGGLEYLVEAGLESLRDLDLSNNRFSNINDLRPLADLRLVSLDLYECPVTRTKDYRSHVFGQIRSLKYLDKMDRDENERPESDDEDEDEEEDPGSGEVDGEDYRNENGHGMVATDGIVDVDEDEESDADEDAAQTLRRVDAGENNGHQYLNGFMFEPLNGVEDQEEGDENEDSIEELDEEDDDEGEDEDVVEVHDVDDSDEDGVDDDDDYGDDDDEVDNYENSFGGHASSSRPMGMEGEIDGHEQGEDDADDDGETGEEEQAVNEDGDFEDDEEADDEEDDCGYGYLIQPVGRVEVDTAGVEGVEMEEEDDDVEEEDCDGEVQELMHSSCLPSHKRKRSSDDDDDDDDDGDEEAEGDTRVEHDDEEEEDR